MPAVNVSQQTYNSFRAAVFHKHGKLRGSLQEEADAALQAHIPKLASIP